MNMERPGWTDFSDRMEDPNAINVDISKFDNVPLEDLHLDVRPRIKNIIEELYAEHDWCWPPAPAKDVRKQRFFKRKKTKCLYNQECMDFATFLSIIIGPLEIYVAIIFAIMPKTFILAMRECVEITTLIVSVFFVQGLFHSYAGILGLGLRSSRPFEIGYVYPHWSFEVALPLLGIFCVFASMYMTQGWLVEKEMIMHLKGYNFHWYSKSMWDFYQNFMQCCGIQGYRDWKYHGPLIYDEKSERTLGVPESCCKVKNCSAAPDPSNVYEGCMDKTMTIFWTLYIIGGVCVAFSIILLCLGHRSLQEASRYSGDPIHKLLFDDRWSKKRIHNRSNRREELFTLLNHYCMILGTELGFDDEVAAAKIEEAEWHKEDKEMETDRDRYEIPDSFTGNSPPTPGSTSDFLDDMYLPRKHADPQEPTLEHTHSPRQEQMGMHFQSKDKEQRVGGAVYSSFSDEFPLGADQKPGRKQQFTVLPSLVETHVKMKEIFDAVDEEEKIGVAFGSALSPPGKFMTEIPKFTSFTSRSKPSVPKSPISQSTTPKKCDSKASDGNKSGKNLSTKRPFSIFDPPPVEQNSEHLSCADKFPYESVSSPAQQEDVILLAQSPSTPERPDLPDNSLLSVQPRVSFVIPEEEIEKQEQPDATAAEGQMKPSGGSRKVSPVISPTFLETDPQDTSTVDPGKVFVEIPHELYPLTPELQIEPAIAESLPEPSILDVEMLETSLEMPQVPEVSVPILELSMPEGLSPLSLREAFSGISVPKIISTQPAEEPLTDRSSCQSFPKVDYEMLLSSDREAKLINEVEARLTMMSNAEDELINLQKDVGESPLQGSDTEESGISSMEPCVFQDEHGLTPQNQSMLNMMVDSLLPWQSTKPAEKTAGASSKIPTKIPTNYFRSALEKAQAQNANEEVPNVTEGVVAASVVEATETWRNYGPGLQRSSSLELLDELGGGNRPFMTGTRLKGKRRQEFEELNSALKEHLGRGKKSGIPTLSQWSSGSASTKGSKSHTPNPSGGTTPKIPVPCKGSKAGSGTVTPTSLGIPTAELEDQQQRNSPKTPDSKIPTRSRPTKK